MTSNDREDSHLCHRRMSAIGLDERLLVTRLRRHQQLIVGDD